MITDRAATLTSHQVKTEAKKAGDDTRGLKDSQKLSCGNGKRVVRQKVDDSLDLVLDSCYPNLRLLFSSLGFNKMACNSSYNNVLPAAPTDPSSSESNASLGLGKGGERVAEALVPQSAILWAAPRPVAQPVQDRLQGGDNQVTVNHLISWALKFVGQRRNCKKYYYILLGS